PPSSTPFPYTTLFRSKLHCLSDWKAAIQNKPTQPRLSSIAVAARLRTDRKRRRSGRPIGICIPSRATVRQHQYSAGHLHAAAVRSEEHTSELQSLAYL